LTAPALPAVAGKGFGRREGVLLFLLVAATGDDRAHARDAHVARATRLLLALVGALYVTPNLISPYFDRYLLSVLPLALAISAHPLREPQAATRSGPSRAASVGAAVALACSASFSVAAVHDYLGWNRARWEAASWLVAECAASPAAIDGGFEWNAAMLYDPSWVARPDKSWWWVDDDRWVIAFGALPERRVVHQVSYLRWLPPFGTGQVLALERGGETPCRAGLVTN